MSNFQPLLRRIGRRERACQPNWIVTPVGSSVAIYKRFRWAEHGRIRPDDYLVNPSLETCFQAKEIKELEKIFRNARMRHLQFISRLLSPWQWEW